ncbi:MAG: HNH endonuclease signature motif containing protein [Propionibacteriaceae bacterium]
MTITVRPVASPEHCYPADSYEIPPRVRDAIRYRNPADVFPWASGTGPAMDLDHTRPYRSLEHGGPPGQTSVDNLGPVVRRHHQSKTQGRMRLRQPAPGVYLWRTTHGYTCLVTSTGTWDLGRTPTADALWRAAAPTHDGPSCPESQHQELVVNRFGPSGEGRYALHHRWGRRRSALASSAKTLAHPSARSTASP